MEDLLIEILEEFGYPVIRQGSMGPNEEYPSRFFTFWNNATSSHSHYDNKVASKVDDFDVNFYSINVSETYKILSQAAAKLRENHFIIDDDGYDVGSDEPSHTGRGMHVLYLRRV